MKRNTDHPHLHALIPAGIMKDGVFYEQRNISTSVIAEIFRARLLTVFHIPSPYESLVYYYGLYEQLALRERTERKQERKSQQPISRIPHPEGLPQTLKLSDSEFSDEVRFLAAAKLYELGKISSGKASKMAGLDRISFLEKLGYYKIPAINIQAEEIEKEIEAVRSLR